MARRWWIPGIGSTHRPWRSRRRGTDEYWCSGISESADCRYISTPVSPRGVPTERDPPRRPLANVQLCLLSAAPTLQIYHGPIPSTGIRSKQKLVHSPGGLCTVRVASLASLPGSARCPRQPNSIRLWRARSDAVQISAVLCRGLQVLRAVPETATSTLSRQL